MKTNPIYNLGFNLNSELNFLIYFRTTTPPPSGSLSFAMALNLLPVSCSYKNQHYLAVYILKIYLSIMTNNDHILNEKLVF